MLKTIVPLVSARPAYTSANEIGLSIDGSKINDKMINLSSFTMRTMSSGTGFLTLKASLAFTQLRKAFIDAPIRHFFDPKRYIWIKTNALGYTIGGVLS